MKAVVKSRGSFKETLSFLKKPEENYEPLLHKYGEEGVELLRIATPKRTGHTSESWSYKITKRKSKWKLTFTNSNKASSGIPVVLLIQYGRVSKTGVYTPGRDFINEPINIIYNKIKKEVLGDANNRGPHIVSRPR